jgi:hypothetical protein
MRNSHSVFLFYFTSCLSFLALLSYEAPLPLKKKEKESTQTHINRKKTPLNHPTQQPQQQQCMDASFVFLFFVR